MFSGGSCFTEEEIGFSCNRYCSATIGAQCNEQIVENIRWTRTPAQQSISIPCPAHSGTRDANKTGTISILLIISTVGHLWPSHVLFHSC